VAATAVQKDSSKATRAIKIFFWLPHFYSDEAFTQV
jgi:hypothetical protein